MVGSNGGDGCIRLAVQRRFSPVLGGTEDTADFVTTGATELRYSGHEFIQNWKTPKGAGACYSVRITTTADGASLSAMFKMK